MFDRDDFIVLAVQVAWLLFVACAYAGLIYMLDIDDANLPACKTEQVK